MVDVTLLLLRNNGLPLLLLPLELLSFHCNLLFCGPPYFFSLYYLSLCL